MLSRRTLARFIVAFVVLATIAFCAAIVYGPEAFWLASEAQYMPFALYLAPALLAVAASFLLGWAWRAAAVLALVLVMTLVMGLEVNSGEQGSPRIRLMTWNIKDYETLRHDDGPLRIAVEIARHSPDVIVMEDARRPAELEARKPGSVSAFTGLEYVHAHGELVVSSRYPLRDCSTEKNAAGYSGPGYVRCTVEAPGGAFDLVTTHFLSPREGLNATRYERLEGISGWRSNVQARMAQAGALAGELQREVPRPLIVAGDLNAPERSLVVHRLLETGLRDAFSSAGTGYGYTYGHFTLGLGISFLRIDHILVSPGIGVTDCFVGGKEVSPHRPVIADLFVKQGPAGKPSGG